MTIGTSSMKEDLAVEYGAQAQTCSLHDGDPGTTGANEISGGSPAYARKTITWTAGAVDGQITSGVLVFDVPAGTSLQYVGIWNGATFKDKAPATAEYDTQGVYRATLVFTEE